jgi:hypothetical protein|tara:strand:+ start:794 stop:1621 length:828 start_codon:yes stop_codon:yes gene_type:complete
MADRINPETVETVKAIREWERKNNFKEACDLPGFTSYKNYFVPDSIVESSKTVLTFGVGGNVGFEKLVAFANKDIHVEMYDPTPWSVSLIEHIVDRSSRNTINAGTGWTGNTARNKAVVKRIHFNPVAYAPENGTLPFYYDPARESEGETISMQQQSFSLIKRQDHFKSLNVKAKNLQSILEALGLTSVDIIKADIEGLWWDFGNEILDKKINCKFIALELELNFEKDGKVETALEKAQILCDKFKENNYDIVINRRREKLMLEMLFIKKDAYEG